MTQGEADVVINAVGMDGKMTDLEFLASGLIIFKEEPLPKQFLTFFPIPVNFFTYRPKNSKSFCQIEVVSSCLSSRTFI